jgi:hypothetical protein
MGADPVVFRHSAATTNLLALDMTRLASPAPSGTLAFRPEAGPPLAQTLAPGGIAGVLVRQRR